MTSATSATPMARRMKREGLATMKGDKLTLITPRKLEQSPVERTETSWHPIVFDEFGHASRDRTCAIFTKHVDQSIGLGQKPDGAHWV